MAAFPMCPACRAEYEDPRDRRYHIEGFCCPECGPALRGFEEGLAALRAGRHRRDQGHRRLPPRLPRRRTSAGGRAKAAEGAADQAPRRHVSRALRPSRPGPSFLRTSARPCYSREAPIVLVPKSRFRRRPPESLAPGQPRSRRVPALRPPPATPPRRYLGAPRDDERQHGRRSPDHRRRGRALGPGRSRRTPRSGTSGGSARRADDGVVFCAGPGELSRVRERAGAPCRGPSGFRLRSPQAYPRRRSRAQVDSLRGLGTRPRREPPHRRPRERAHLRGLPPRGRGDPRLLRRRARASRLRPPSRLRVHALCDRVRRAALASPWSGSSTITPISSLGPLRPRRLASARGLGAPSSASSSTGRATGATGAIWGGEILLGDERASSAASTSPTSSLPGGEAAIREPWRILGRWALASSAGIAGRGEAELEAIARIAANPAFSPPTSSCGRLFDAAAALLGFDGRVSFEGEAAIWLESLAAEALAAEARGPRRPRRRQPAFHRSRVRADGWARPPRGHGRGAAPRGAGARAGARAGDRDLLARLALGFHRSLGAEYSRRGGFDRLRAGTCARPSSREGSSRTASSRERARVGPRRPGHRGPPAAPRPGRTMPASPWGRRSSRSRAARVYCRQ